MRRLSCLFLLTLTAIMASGAPAVARVTASDATATHAYLEATIAMRRASGVTEMGELNAIKALEAQVKTECPDILAGAPPHVKGEKTNQSEGEISDELMTAAFGAAEHVQHPSDERFARTVRRLRWSNPRLTRLLRSLALEQAEQSAIPTPNLCADTKFWVASGFTTVSAGTKQFLHRHSVVSSITQIESEPHEPVTDIFNLSALVAHRLRPYEDRADRKLSRTALPPERNLADALRNPAVQAFFAAAGEVLVALGRTTPPAA